MTFTSQPLPCPHCSAALDLNEAACTTCGLHLRGPRAARLWQIDQQLALLSSERSMLIGTLLAGPDPARESSAADPVDQSTLSSVSPHMSSPARRASPTGQQILLGLGALLVLSAATFLGAVVWMIVGIWGQALLLSTMIALAVFGTVLATRRGLPAAAETGAVLSSGFTTVALWAAWSLDLGGLHGVPSLLYAALAALAIGALVLGYDRLVPRRGGDGEPLRRVLTFQPVAVTALSLAPWFALAELEPSGVGIPIGLGLVALLSVALWLGARPLDVQPLSTLPPAISTSLAVVLYVISGLAVAYSLDTPTREWSALLMVVSAAGLALIVARTRVPGPIEAPTRLAAWIVAALAAWSFTWEAHWEYLCVAAVISAAAAVGLVLIPLATEASDSIGHRRARVTFALTGAGLTLQLCVLLVTDTPTLFGNQVGEGPTRLLVAGVAAVWAAASLFVALRLRAVPWLVFAHLGLTAALATGLIDSTGATQTVVWLVAGIALAVAAGAPALLDPAHPESSGWETVPAVFAAGYASVSVMTSIALPHPWTAWTLITVGVVTFAYSLLPGRLMVAYVAAPAIATGVALLANGAGWNAVEVYTWPLAMLFAIIGWRHWQRSRDVPSWISMGPALGTALLPSVLVAVEDGDAWRLGLGTAAAVTLLLLGVTGRLQAPVAVGGVALAYIGVTQGGPYLALLPGWLTLGVAGVALLAIGVSWERAIVAGRRGNAWFSQLG